MRSEARNLGMGSSGCERIGRLKKFGDQNVGRSGKQETKTTGDWKMRRWEYGRS